MSFLTNMIVIWSGAIVDIPFGWALCDGNNGTPNLQDRFIVGAGDSYAVDDNGGANTHAHDFTSDGHAHSLAAGTDLGAGSGFDTATDNQIDTGHTTTVDHRPPYYALAYIMKT